MQDQMTPRERWLAVLNGEDFDRFPLDYRATPEVNEQLVEYMGASGMAEVRERLHISPVMGVGGRYVGPELEPMKDVFGIGYEMMDYGTGVYREAVYHPLAEYTSVEEIEGNYTWPEPDWWTYDHIPEQLEGKEEWVIQGGHYEQFATYKWLRGVEQGYADHVENPEMLRYCMQKLADIAYSNSERTFEAAGGRVIWTWVAEDFGTQEGLLISPAMIREFHYPHIKRLCGLAHDYGVFAFHHSDGAVRDNIPQMIEAGIDVLDPVQWRCRGMEREGLKRDFGDRIGFHGAMDNQQTVPFGTVEDVRQEVRDNFRILGEGGGYILGPCHNIQPVTPMENVVAIYETGYEEGWQ
ncbi:MAG: uroporphyrinogen-III decarboxylase-like protein [Armatimonadia bacterium]|nr:uroporphyrinogen-III decarboxylase-like protein [Armatimonadia bacterium]